MKPREGQKRAIFLSLILGKRGGGGGCRFSIYFVQNKMDQQTPISPNQGWSRAKGKTRHFPILDLGVEGGGGEEGGF